VVVVAASTLESTRLLLNSKSRQHPQGLGNSSGVLGHYLVDHFGGIGAQGTSMCWRVATRYTRTAKRRASSSRASATGTKRRVIRGYGFECSAGASRLPGFAKNPAVAPGFGSEFKKSVRHSYTAPVSMTTRAAMLERFENYAEIDPNGIVDAWGIPVLKIHIRHSDNEREMARDAAEASEEILRAAGAEVVSTGGKMTVPGHIIHELGTARLGADPKLSQAARPGPYNDCATLSPLVDAAQQATPRGLVLADAEFDSERNHQHVRQVLGAKSIIPDKRGKADWKIKGVRAQMRKHFPRKQYGICFCSVLVTVSLYGRS
jgi:hypothetical protein